MLLYLFTVVNNKSSCFGSLKIRNPLLTSHYIPGHDNICLYCGVQQHGYLSSNPLGGHAPQSKGDIIDLPGWEDWKQLP